MDTTQVEPLRPRATPDRTRRARGPVAEEAVTTAAIAALEPALGQRLASLGIATLNLRAGSTLGRSLWADGSFEVVGLPEGLVSLGAVLAEGGMGEVLGGTQHRLRREVAVKRAPPDASGEAHRAMLQEAWIAGSLEHPNILPIHTLTRAGDAPLIVMKRVHGRVWSELLADARRSAASEAGLDDALAVLVEVCRAVHFAHSRGVLHLDLKPDNVMVGEHCEVLLLDWGVAAAFDPHLAPDFIPRTDAIRRIVGTLGYLSPEQSRGFGADFGRETDVYLLGAVLHEILTGAAPHATGTSASMLLSLVSSHRAAPPVYDPSVPEELAAIARRALAREPSERFPDVDAFRRAVEAFVEHRPALALVARADALRDELAAERPTLVGRSSMQALTEEVASESRFDACRFAYQQALRTYPGCEPARKGLAALAQLRFQRAEQKLDVAAAEAALADHPAPDDALRARFVALEEAARADAERMRELRALSADEDVMRDRALRIRLAVIGGSSWSVWNLVTGYLDRSGVLPVTATVLLTHVTLAFAVVLVVLASVGRRAVTSTAVNRRALTIVFAAFAETFLLWIGGAQLGLEAHRIAVLAFGGYVLAALAVAAVLDRRTWWGALVMLVPAFAAARHPEYVFYFTACLGPLGALGLAYLWERPLLEAEGAA